MERTTCKSRAPPCLAGSPLELPSVGDSELKWGWAVSFSPAPLQCECIWFGLLFLTFLLSLGWLYVVLILLNDLHNFNECVTDPLPQQTCQPIPHLGTPGCSVIPSPAWLAPYPASLKTPP